MSLPPTPQKPRRIVLATEVTHEEAVSDIAGIKPGHLVQIGSGKLAVVHPTQGGYWNRLVATEDALFSLNDPSSTPTSVDSAYGASAVVSLYQAKPGDRINLLLRAGVNYPVGAQLISAGDGTAKLASAAGTGVTVKQIVGEIDEHGGGVDLSGTGAVATRCSVRVF